MRQGWGLGMLGRGRGLYGGLGAMHGGEERGAARLPSMLGVEAGGGGVRTERVGERCQARRRGQGVVVDAERRPFFVVVRDARVEIVVQGESEGKVPRCESVAA